MSALAVARQARSALEELTGFKADAIARVARSEQGWLVAVDLVESRGQLRENDLLATYEVELDPLGEVVGYKRTRRYQRNHAIDEG